MAVRGSTNRRSLDGHRLITSLDLVACVVARVPIESQAYDVTGQAIGDVGGRFSPRRRKQCAQPGCAFRPGGSIAGSSA